MNPEGEESKGGCPFFNQNTGPVEYNKAGVYYNDYLRLNDLLSLQHPESAAGGTAAHEETLFIIIHQVYELWFKQILHELSSICDLFSQPLLHERSMGVVVNRLERIVSIMKILVDQITVLETMHPLDFLEFRDKLTPASGFQSVQFRILENKLGMHAKLRVQYMQTHYHTFFSEDHQKRLVDSEGQESLLVYIIRWLERMPFLQYGEEFNFWDSYKRSVATLIEKDKSAIADDPRIPPDVREVQLKEVQKNEESFGTLFNEELYKQRLERGDVRFSYRAMQAALFICLYKDEPICHMPHRVLNLLTDIDEQLALWRYRHTLMVQRMIGVKIGTGGSSGYHYLRSTVGDRYKIFIDIYNLASYFIPRSMLPKLPNGMQPQMDFVWSQNQLNNHSNGKTAETPDGRKE